MMTYRKKFCRIDPADHEALLNKNLCHLSCGEYASVDKSFCHQPSRNNPPRVFHSQRNLNLPIRKNIAQVTLRAKERHKKTESPNWVA